MKGRSVAHDASRVDAANARPITRAGNNDQYQLHLFPKLLPDVREAARVRHLAHDRQVKVDQANERWSVRMGWTS